VIARLIGGRADGWLCTVRSTEPYITMIDSYPRPMPDDLRVPGALDLLNRAHRQWECYKRIEYMAPDPNGNIAFWCVIPLPPATKIPPDQARTGLTTQHLQTLEDQIAVKPAAEHWQLLRTVLQHAGHTLREPPRRLHESEPSTSNPQARSTQDHQRRAADNTYIGTD
jgi:hypothetical protein